MCYNKYISICVCVCVCVCVCISHSAMSDSLQPNGLQPIRLLCPWNTPGKNTRVGCHSTLQGVFPTQGLNLSLLHYRQILHHLSHQGSPFRIYPVFLHCSYSCECIRDKYIQFNSIQFSISVMSDSETPWTAACQASLSITNSRSLLKLMSIQSVMPSNHLIL